jgi:ribosomal protein S18 acetylase RimI-like enzyme
MTLHETMIRSLEERAFNAWPALQTVFCDGWVFRISGGYTKRANSVNALTPTGAFPEVLRAADSFYRAQGQPTIFRLSPLAGTEPDEVLAGLGFGVIDETRVMTADLAFDAAIDPGVAIARVPDEAWRHGFAEANAVASEKRGIHDQMLAAIKLPAAFATLSENGQALAYGLAVAERGMVGLFDIVTVPAARRRGAGRRLVSSLLAWGRSEGATAAYLQVVATNAPAIALYERFGFREAYRYHYRVRVAK